MHGSELTPRAWCRRILGALTERQADGEDAACLALLLTCLIDLNPRADEFEALLARYAADWRPGVADAAEVLQGAWRRATRDASVEPHPPLRERLRVVGALLDEDGARSALVQVSDERVRVQVFDSGNQRSLSILELRHEIAGRQTLRGRLVVGDPTRPDRHEARLRAVGFRLEAEAPQTYELFVSPRAIVVEGQAGYFHIFEQEELAAALRQAVGQRLATDNTPDGLVWTVQPVGSAAWPASQAGRDG